MSDKRQKNQLELAFTDESRSEAPRVSAEGTESLAGTRGTESLAIGEQLMEEVQGLLPPSISEEELGAHFATLPPRYFQIASAREILQDLILAHRFMRLQISEATFNGTLPSRTLRRLRSAPTN